MRDPHEHFIDYEPEPLDTGPGLIAALLIAASLSSAAAIIAGLALLLWSAPADGGSRPECWEEHSQSEDQK